MLVLLLHHRKTLPQQNTFQGNTREILISFISQKLPLSQQDRRWLIY